MPTADQLRELADAAYRNALALAADARLLLEAGGFPRAHALAVLALEELGKVDLCQEVLAGELDERDFRRDWGSHLAKLDRTRLAAILCSTSVERVFATVDNDCAMKLRGLYVDVPAEPGGAPCTPSDVEPAAARDMVQTAQATIAFYLDPAHRGLRATE